MKYICFLVLLGVFAANAGAQQTTYWNPITIDYGYTPIPDFANRGRHRTTADPVVVVNNGDYYLFSANQTGYWMSTNPKGNEWKPRIDRFETGGWNPSFFADDDGRLYMYNGSSNIYPMYSVELHRHNVSPVGTRKEMHLLEPRRSGWQRFGENMDNTFLDSFIEGSHKTKYKGKYYLPYGAQQS